MFITRDRQIVVNVNLNSFDKIGRDADQELLMLYISLLKICHTMLLIEPEMEARNCIRLLRSAELMDYGYEKLGLNAEYLPNIIFVASNEWTTTTSCFVQSLFKGSRLQVDLVDKWHNETAMLQNISKLTFRFPRASMSSQTTPPFTEQHWYQNVQSLWKLHKTNYFLVKYAKGSSF